MKISKFLEKDVNAKWAWEWLVECGIEDTDRPLAEAFCRSYSRWRIAEKDIDTFGITIEGAKSTIQNPAVLIANKCTDEMGKLARALNLTREQRMKVKDLDGGEDEMTEFERS